MRAPVLLMFSWAEIRRKINNEREATLYSQDALLLIGHGSTDLPEAARPLREHAAKLHQTGTFKETAVGMLNGEPNATEAFRSLNAPVVHVVPFFLEDGYFTRIAIPDLLSPLADSSKLIHFRRPIGTHEELPGLIEKRLLRHCELYGISPKFLSVLLAGHGSSRNPGRAFMARRHAARLEATGRFSAVRTAFLEEPPLVAETLATSRGNPVAVVGYFANAGAHATQDLPRMIAEERHYRGTNWPPVHDLGTIGGDEGMPRLILDLVQAPR